MIRSTLTLGEVYKLYTELTGLFQGTQVIQGLMGQSLDLSFKFDLTQLLKKLQSHIEDIDKLRNDLIGKYGVEKDGMTSIPSEVEIEEDGETKTVPNPVLAEVREQLDGLMNKEVVIEHTPFEKDQLKGIKTGEHYPAFFQLIENSSQPL